jgi:hypothetical protein
VVECTAEHQGIEAVIAELRQMGLDDSRFEAKIEDLIPRAEKVLDEDKLCDLAREHLAKRRELEEREFGPSDEGSRRDVA